ncbi:MAG: phosphohistidine phosphatase SixA [Chloroflexi bacterium]|nr:phosphohistidine phosphatase SixA [Chloroflexota bacterium]
MNLYFLRHGLADWPHWNRSDSERPLTEEGIAKMKAEGKTLKRLDVSPDAILSSPLVRARQTADIVAERLGLAVVEHKLLAPGFNREKLAAILGEHKKAKAIMLVGHEPDFGRTIAEIIGGGRVAMKKGGLARVDIASPDSLNGELVWLLAPKVLTNDEG